MLLLVNVNIAIWCEVTGRDSRAQCICYGLFTREYVHRKASLYVHTPTHKRTQTFTATLGRCLAACYMICNVPVDWKYWGMPELQTLRPGSYSSPSGVRHHSGLGMESGLSDPLRSNSRSCTRDIDPRSPESHPTVSAASPGLRSGKKLENHAHQSELIRCECDI